MFKSPKQSITKLFLASFTLFAFQAHAQSTIIEQNKEETQVFSTADLIGKSNPNLTQGKDYKVLPEVAVQLEKMKADAKKAGFDICVISSYRSYKYQNVIWERKFKANKAKGLSNIKNIEKIIEYSTIPGTSRHHWGTDIDIIDMTKGIPADPLHEKHFNEGGSMRKFKLWLDENAHKYGFYLVYTKSLERKGFKYEPWHFTYKPISDRMMEEYKKLDIKKLLQENKLMGSEFFTDEFVEKYRTENILDINPELNK
ncbi:M15 family metallopeptidase [Faecalibacter bovis]|uniref:M15 family metallopeptidase n=1 Tax=Faecalibacter bovis TaxID=2898187 RepID=A0ABX7XCN6_9FLAO|nr:M15 family metallopeptidase [Faecalibacter bovis]MBS7333150.1 M15 family metallopeptidase [Weeksellaceae bacterium]QTV05650.1 M15 family metallopeptidase [Faecalibacter bovis]